jgi:hypothetical protein
MTSNGSAEALQSSADRRINRRFALSLALRYKVTRRRRLIEMGSGRTVDISSGGAAFMTAHVLPPKAQAELWLEWPVPLNGHPLRLLMQGRVVRSNDGLAAVKISRHEFRLAGNALAHAGAQGGTVARFGAPAARVGSGK